MHGTRILITGAIAGKCIVVVPLADKCIIVIFSKTSLPLFVSGLSLLGISIAVPRVVAMPDLGRGVLAGVSIGLLLLALIAGGTSVRRTA